MKLKENLVAYFNKNSGTCLKGQRDGTIRDNIIQNCRL